MKAIHTLIASVVAAAILHDPPATLADQPLAITFDEAQVAIAAVATGNHFPHNVEIQPEVAAGTRTLKVFCRNEKQLRELVAEVAVIRRKKPSFTIRIVTDGQYRGQTSKLTLACAAMVEAARVLTARKPTNKGIFLKLQGDEKSFSILADRLPPTHMPLFISLSRSLRIEEVEVGR
jgi:hypothetical protein